MLSTDSGLMRYTRGTGFEFDETSLLSRDVAGVPSYRCVAPGMVPLEDATDAAQVFERSASTYAT